MEDIHTPRWESLERWSPTLFLAAGVLFVGHAAVRGIEAFTTMPPPVDIFGPSGYVAAILALLGVVPSLADRTPRTARIVGVSAGIMGAAWVLIAGWNFGEAAGILPPQTEIFPGVFFGVMIVATLLLYLLFAVADLRAGVHSRTFSILLMAPVAMLALLILGAMVLSIRSAAGGVVIGGGMAIIHGAIGGTLLTGRFQTSQKARTADITTE